MRVNSIFCPGAANAGLVAAPITADWIIQGNPQARSMLVAQCGVFTTTIWDCSAGSFVWHYATDESVTILEGEAVITDMSGVSRTLRAGDAAMFAEGDSLHWNVPRYVRKFAVWGQPGPVVARYVLRKLGHRASRLATGIGSGPARRANGRPAVAAAAGQA